MKKRAGILILMTGILIFLVYFYMIRSDAEAEYYFICIPKLLSRENEFWGIMEEGAEIAAKEYNVRVKFMAAAREEDYEEQNRIILEAISEKPDAIILAAADYEKTCEAARKIKQAGIVLVMIDSGIKEQELIDTIIATDNVQAGIRLGAVAKKYIKDGKLGVISFVQGSQSSIDREEGLRIGLSDDQDKIVSTYYCNSDREQAYRGTLDMLKAYPDITVLLGLNQYSALGAADALIELGLSGKVKLIGIDSSIEQIRFLEEGVFEAIVVQRPFNIGFLGVEKALKLSNGEYVAAKLDSGSTLITKDNMYIGMNQKILFHFREEEE